MGDQTIPYGRHLVEQDDIAAVVDVLRGDWLTTGPAVDAFEDALSNLTGRHPVVAVNSGTAALHAAYAAAGVAPGTNIVTTPMTFAATATAALHLGAEVRFADVHDGTLLIDPDAVAAAVSDRTRVIAAVDYAGQPADMERLRVIAEDVGAVLIEDAAHSIGGRYRDRPVGDSADMTTFSFHPVKTVTTGEGGAVVVRDTRMLEAVRRFRNHGLVRNPADLIAPDEGGWHQEVQSLGLNYRMPDILAALGRSQLGKLQRFVNRRSRLVERYQAALEELPDVRLIEVRPDVDAAWHLFPIRILGGRRRTIFDKLRSRGIAVQVHYLPVYRHPLFAGSRHSPCPVAESAYEELISLPLFAGLSDEEQERVIREVHSLLG